MKTILMCAYKAINLNLHEEKYIILIILPDLAESYEQSHIHY